MLNEQFVNVFVLLGDLPEFQSGTTGESVSTLAKTIDTTLEAAVAQHKIGRSVNTFILSPQLELIGHLPYRKPGAPHITEEIYGTFLRESLDGKRLGFEEDISELQSTGSETLSNSSAAFIDGLNIVLTREKPEQEILNIFRTPERGFQDYTVVEIDTTAFKAGGVLTIDISVGNAKAAGSFDLFDNGSELPTEGVPRNALVSTYGIRPSGKGIIEHDFDQGQIFKLGATGDWFSEKGSVNAFLAKISVEPNQKPEPKKVSSVSQEQSAEDVMNAFVKAFKNLDSEAIRSMLTGDASDTFAGGFEDVPENMRTQLSQMLNQMEVLSNEYVGDEYHFRLRVPGANPPEVSVKMRKVEGIWLIYEAK